MFSSPRNVTTLCFDRSSNARNFTSSSPVWILSYDIALCIFQGAQYPITGRSQGRCGGQSREPSRHDFADHAPASLTRHSTYPKQRSTTDVRGGNRQAEPAGSDDNQRGGQVGGEPL